MANLTDITAVTDRVLDCYLEIKGGTDGVIVEHLTTTERAQLCDLLGVNPSTPAPPPANPRGFFLIICACFVDGD